MAASPQTDMEDAFQAFMLGGKNKKKKAMTDNSPKKHPTTPKPPITPRHTRESTSSRHSNTTKQQQDYRAFQNLHQEWTETDETLYALVGSVIDLRQRLYYTMQEQQFCFKKQKDIENGTWKSLGFRSQRALNDPSWLQPHDYDIALDHILLQHEKALQNIRRLLGNQSQTIDSMARRLEFLLLGSGENDSAVECQDSFRYLSRELYRKQILAQRLFASVQDTLLTTLDPWETARSCYKQWRQAPR
jgi:hypothetical protein